MHARITRRKITACGLHRPIDPRRADNTGNHGTVGAAARAVQCAEADPVSVITHLVDQQANRSVAVDDQQIHATVVVYISERHATAGTGQWLDRPSGRIDPFESESSSPKHIRFRITRRNIFLVRTTDGTVGFKQVQCRIVVEVRHPHTKSRIPFAVGGQSD